MVWDKRDVLFVGRGHAPAAHVGFLPHLPSSTSPKPSPSGEGGSPQARRMRGGSVKATASAKNPTFPPRICQKSKFFASFHPGGSLFSKNRTKQTDPLRPVCALGTSPKGRGKAACRRQCGFTSAPTEFHRTKAFPLGGRWPGEAGADEGWQRKSYHQRQKSNVSIPYPSKIKDFRQLLPRGKPFLCQFLCIQKIGRTAEIWQSSRFSY